MYKILDKIKDLGPGALVTAAFIGPGTVTTCIVAGISTGTELLWALTFATIATIILQDMASRVGIVTKLSLEQLIVKSITSSTIRGLVVVLILLAIVVGNTAYEAGNITGTMLGLNILTKGGSLFLPLAAVAIIIGLVAYALLWMDSFSKLQNILIAAVILMSITFFVSAVLVKPNFFELVKNSVRVSLPKGSFLTAASLIGTTIVPYNLFLHSYFAKKKWSHVDNLPKARLDTIISVGLGGLISMSIMVVAASCVGKQVSIAQIASILESNIGSWSPIFIGLGLTAAGITSTITAPLAAGIVANSLIVRKKSDSKTQRWVWLLVIGFGVIFSSLGYSPIYLIKLAQVANAIVLPFAVGFLLFAANSERYMHTYKNKTFANAAGGMVFLVSLFLGGKALYLLLQ
jgi:Mn2+/Fe2+ NRAMP family transporter